MNILFIDWSCFGKIDAIFTLKQAGHQLTMFQHQDYQELISPAFDSAFSLAMENNSFHLCFSFNYYPLVAENCHKYGLKYLSVVYDSPYVPLYSYTLIYPTNYVFLFDRHEYEKFKKAGITTVYYTVLPVNSTIIDFLAEKDFDRERFTCDISFVGALYNEAHNFYDRLQGINDYTRGYLDAVMEAQLKVYGYNFLEEVLTPDITSELRRVCEYSSNSYGVETPEYIYANYFLGRKITSMERLRILTAVGAAYPLKLFTLNKDLSIPHVQNMGAADYYSEMPYIFANSKINLNITLRSIQSGIPLRAMDIMGAGGFLLTNFQEDFLDYFIPDVDFVYYTDQTDLLDKIGFYLKHEEERKKIAENGHRKVLENHSFEKWFSHAFSILFPVQ